MTLGVEARENALLWELIFQVSTAKRKMSMSKTYTAENMLGWACLISTLKGRLFGAMEHRLTFITGQSTNQTTFAMKTVSTPSGLFMNMRISGTMSIVQTVTSSLARKVRMFHNGIKLVVSATFIFCYIVSVQRQTASLCYN